MPWNNGISFCFGSVLMEFRDPKIFGPQKWWWINGDESHGIPIRKKITNKTHPRTCNSKLTKHFRYLEWWLKLHWIHCYCPPYSLPHRTSTNLVRGHGSSWADLCDPRVGESQGKVTQRQGGSLPLQGVILKGGAHLMPRGFRNLNFTL